MKNQQNWSAKVFGAALLALCGMVGNANAALVSLGTFGGNDCGGQGGFGNCYATQEGVQQGAPTSLLLLGSPSVYKLNSNENAPTGSEDFGAFLQVIPGAFMFIGNGEGSHRSAGHGLGPCMLHNPSYDFNDELIPLGATMWVRLAETWLSR